MGPDIFTRKFPQKNFLYRAPLYKDPKKFPKKFLFISSCPLYGTRTGGYNGGVTGGRGT